jgi:hypothetical protein
MQKSSQKKDLLRDKSPVYFSGRVIFQIQLLFVFISDMGATHEKTES